MSEHFFQLAPPSLLDLGKEELAKEIDRQINFYEGELSRYERGVSNSISMDKIERKLGGWKALERESKRLKII